MNNRRSLIAAVVAATLFFGSLIGSLIAYAVAPPLLRPLTIVFPAEGGGVRYERRQVPFSRDPAELARSVVAETLLGPIDVTKTNSFNERTRLRDFLYRDRIAYVDLDPYAVLQESRTPTPADASAILWESLRRNVPRIAGLVVAIDGREVYRAPQPDPDAPETQAQPIQEASAPEPLDTEIDDP